MDADGLKAARPLEAVTFACATTAERRAAERAGLPTALVGVAAANGIPDGEVVSFGLAGGLDGLEPGAVIDATRIVDVEGHVLWEGDGLGVRDAVPGTILASDRIVDDPEERRRLHARTGADAVDLESGPLAAGGRLRGVVRAVSDTPERPLGGLAGGVKPQGTYDWPGLARAFARTPRGFVRTARDSTRALARLTAAARRLPR